MEIGLLLVPVAAIAVVALTIKNKKRLAAGLATSTEQTAGAIARRLGLELVAGDPTLNFLYLMQPAGDSTYGEYERSVRMVGSPYGRGVDLTLADGRTVDKGAWNMMVKREAVNHWRCSLSMKLNVNVPPFELTLRNPNEYLRPSCSITGQIPDASLGSPAADGLFRLAAVDPRVGPMIANAVHGLSHHGFVHVHAHDGIIEMFLTRMGLPYFANAAEEYELSLETIACALEGRPAPATMPRAA